MKASDIDYFPMNRALALTHTLSDNEKRLNELKTIMNTMMGKFNSLQVRTYVAAKEFSGTSNKRENEPKVQ